MALAQNVLASTFTTDAADIYISPDQANTGLRRPLLRGGIGQFDGSGHAVDAAYAIPAGALVEFECRIRLSSLAADQMIMYTELGSAAGGLGLKYDTAEDRFEIAKVAVGPRAWSTSSVLVDTWNTIMFSYNMTSGAYSFTINGVAAGSGTDASVPAFDLTSFTLGRANTTQRFSGDMAWCKLAVNSTPILSYDFSYAGLSGQTRVPNLLSGAGAGTYDGTLAGDAGTFWGTALEIDTPTSRNRAGYNLTASGYIPRLDTTVNKALADASQLDVDGNALLNYGSAPLDLRLKSATCTTNGTDNGCSIAGLTPFATASDYDAEFVFRYLSGDTIFASSTDTNNRIAVRVTGGTLRCAIYNGTAYLYGQSIAFADTETKHTLVIDYDATGSLACALDGVAFTLDGSVPNTASNAGTKLAVKTDGSLPASVEFYAATIQGSHYNFGATSGTQAYDSNGNGNHATWTGDIANLHTTSEYQRPNNNIDGFNGENVSKNLGELITNGDFLATPPSTGWSTAGESSISTGVARILSTGAYSYIRQEGVQEIGKTYRYSYTIDGTPSGNINAETLGGTMPSLAGTNVHVGVATAAHCTIKRDGVCDVLITNFQVDEVTPDDSLCPADASNPGYDVFGNAIEYDGDDTGLNGSETTWSQLPNASQLQAIAEENFSTNPWFDGSDDPEVGTQADIDSDYESERVWQTILRDSKLDWRVFSEALADSAGARRRRQIMMYLAKDKRIR